ncbi:hypothetical protein E2P81_ATG10363 [Venturia nashicola]|nr:hypothetical protein E2P81_ATG10363 [Venturia nashicola]
MALNEATFALLQPPSFDVLPDTDIQLGTILPRTKSNPRRPDTKRPLNRSSRVDVPDELYRRRTDPSVVLDEERLRSGGGGIKLNLPILPVIGGGLGGEGSKESILHIVAKDVETQWFLPDSSYFAKAVQGIAVRKELLHFSAPSVFMVTGVKIAETALIVTGTKRSASSEIGPEVDLTAFGIPVEVAASINAKREKYRIIPIQKSRFVLAFETRRVKIKGEQVTEEDFNDFALLDDDDLDPEEQSEALHEKLDFDEVTTEVEEE